MFRAVPSLLITAQADALTADVWILLTDEE